MPELILTILAGLVILGVVVERLRDRLDSRSADLESARSRAALLRELRRHG